MRPAPLVIGWGSEAKRPGGVSCWGPCHPPASVYHMCQSALSVPRQKTSTTPGWLPMGKGSEPSGPPPRLAAACQVPGDGL